MADFVLPGDIQQILQRAEDLRQQYERLVRGMNAHIAESARFRDELTPIIEAIREALGGVDAIMPQLEECINRLRGAERNIEAVYAAIRDILDTAQWQDDGGALRAAALAGAADDALAALRDQNNAVRDALTAERDRVTALRERLNGALERCQEAMSANARLGAEIRGAGGERSGGSTARVDGRVRSPAAPPRGAACPRTAIQPR